ncbi:MAG: NTP transferase domain-containing protein [Lachnospiraceae bacterium]
MIHVIYMAAGNSRRFGSNKLLYLYEGKPLYRHGLELLLELKQEMGEKLTVTVVTQYPEILEEVQDIFERCGMAGMQAVFCEKSRLGASYTIRAGIEAVISQDPVSGQPKEGQSMMGEKDYLMFMVADQPHLTLDSVRKLIRTAVSREQSAFSGPLAEECSRWETLSLRCGSTPGNPCMFRADLIPELMSLTGDQGGRKVLKQRACKYVDILDKRELEDVDEMLQVTENLGEK